MNLSGFLESPAKNDHPNYKLSFFPMRPAVEYATGEVMISSLYRAVGFPNISEKDVSRFGRYYDKRIKKPPKILSDRENSLSAKSWERLVREILKSPKQPNQSKKNFLQLSPITPTVTALSSSARLRGNSWNPGELIKRTLGFSNASENHISKIWEDIFTSLSIADNDDIWAKFIDKELIDWKPPNIEISWKKIPYGNNFPITRSDAKEIVSPANRFAKDTELILSIKSVLSRRQWISIFESIIRIGSASHILWICHVNEVLLNFIWKSLEGKEIDRSTLVTNLSLPEKGFWRYGDKAMTIIKHLVRKYYSARLGINLFLHFYESKGNLNQEYDLSSLDGLHSFIC